MSDDIHPVITWRHLLVDLGRPVVFLDFDGVLNGGWQHENYEKTVRINKLFRPPHKGDWVCPHRLAMMRDILHKHNTQVVIVSSWLSGNLSGHDRQVQELREFTQFPSILGSLRTGGGQERAEDIALMSHDLGLSRWVVIDDSDQWYRAVHEFDMKHLISPHGRYGLTDRDFSILDDYLSGHYDSVFFNDLP